MRKRGAWLALCVGFCVLLAGTSAHTSADGDADITELLIALLKAGCSVVGEHQSLINDPSKGKKGFTDAYVSHAIVEKLKAEAQIDLSHFTNTLYGGYVLAMLQSEREVVFDVQPAINKPGIGFKGFVPSVFAHKVGKKFYAKTGIMMKVTRADHSFTNNKPDDFEAEVLHMFADPRHPKGQRYLKATVVNGKPVMRAIYPEYTDATWTVCDGGPNGEYGTSGMHRESWGSSRFACAISVIVPMR